jgi:hypothetical protein
MPRQFRFARRTLVLAASAAAAIAVAAPSAHAGVLVASATNCDDQSFSQPFTPWLDPASYVLAPGGTFEDGASSFDVTGDAATVAGNEPFYVHGAGESTSLRLPSGSSATTASMCVGIEHPTLRFFARRDSGVISTLKVEVLFEDALGSVHAVTIGSVVSGGWAPTVQMPVVANLLPLLPGDRTAVAFRFTANGGTYRIDDVYVDPWRGH